MVTLGREVIGAAPQSVTLPHCFDPMKFFRCSPFSFLFSTRRIPVGSKARLSTLFAELGIPDVAVYFSFRPKAPTPMPTPTNLG
jgi:hypothetical protein